MMISSLEDFKEWTTLNDTIMGGSSKVSCSVVDQGLNIKGEIIEKGGGFISCRSPVFYKPLDLKKYKGLNIEMEGDGRTYKIAIACNYNLYGLTNTLYRGIRWVAEFPTLDYGLSKINVCFDNLEPSIRAKKVFFPFTFNKSSIVQIQLLHSKFGKPGYENNGFRPGSINIILRSISAFT